jgi:hypothetical protein
MEEDKVVPLDDIETQRKREEALQQLSNLGQEIEKVRKVYEHDNDTWWNGATVLQVNSMSVNYEYAMELL